jgi:hypothetical protein
MDLRIVALLLVLIAQQYRPQLGQEGNAAVGGAFAAMANMVAIAHLGSENIVMSVVIAEALGLFRQPTICRSVWCRERFNDKFKEMNEPYLEGIPVASSVLQPGR